MAGIAILDRRDRELKVGDALQVQRVVGPYGQVALVQGVIHSLDSVVPGVTLKLTAPAYRQNREFREFVAVGQLMYLALPGAFIGDTFICFKENTDCEHGCITWAEVTSPAGE